MSDNEQEETPEEKRLKEKSNKDWAEAVERIDIAINEELKVGNVNPLDLFEFFAFALGKCIPLLDPDLMTEDMVSKTLQDKMMEGTADTIKNIKNRKQPIN